MKLIPTTQSQNLMLLMLRYAVKKSVTNICGMVYFDVAVDEDMMRRAVTMAFERSDATSIRLHKVGKEYYQYVSDEAPSETETVDFRGKSEKEYRRTVDKWNTAPFPHGACDVELHRTRFVILPDGKQALHFCISHVIVDAYSLLMLLKDMIAAYRFLHDGKPLPEPTTSCVPVYEAEVEYAKSEKCKRETAYFIDEVSATEPFYASVNGPDGCDCRKGKRYGFPVRIIRCNGAALNLRIPKALNDRVNVYASENGMSPALLYMLAARSFLSVENNSDDVTMGNMIARRSTLAQKKTGGILFTMHMLRSVISRDASFREAAEKLKKCQTGVFRHANADPIAAMYGMTNKYGVPDTGGYHSMHFTYQPYVALDDGSLPCHFERMSNGTSTVPLYMSIMAMDFSGDLVVNYEHNPTIIKPERLRKMHEYILRFLDAGISDPDRKISEL